MAKRKPGPAFQWKPSRYWKRTSLLDAWWVSLQTVWGSLQGAALGYWWAPRVTRLAARSVNTRPAFEQAAEPGSPRRSPRTCDQVPLWGFGGIFSTYAKTCKARLIEGGSYIYIHFPFWMNFRNTFERHLTPPHSRKKLRFFSCKFMIKISIPKSLRIIFAGSSKNGTHVNKNNMFQLRL